MVTTKLGKARTKGDFYRTSFPVNIVRQLKLKEGDELDWDLEVRNGDLVVVITPKK